jgi:hypothetical protein
MGSSPIEVTIFFCFLLLSFAFFCSLLLSSARLRFLAASFCSDRINILLGQREPSYSGLLFEIPITLLSRGPRFESEWFLLFAALGYHQPCLIAISIYLSRGFISHPLLPSRAKAKSSRTGNRTPVSRVTGGHLNHWTIQDLLEASQLLATT